MQAINILPHWTPEENDVRFVAQNRDWALERKIKKRTTDTIHQMYNWAVGMNYDAMILGNHAFDEGHSTHVIAGELENSKCYLIKS